MISDSFSLIRGGPVYRLLDAVGAIRTGVRTSPLVAALLVGVAFVPLAALTLAAGTLLPERGFIALLADYALMARLLIAMPVLVMSAAPGDDILRRAMRYVGRSGLVVATDRPRFDAIVRRGHALRDSNIPELLCALIAIGTAFWTDANFSHVPGVAHWALAADGGLSPAGQWFAWVSAPIFRFVGLIWIWRYLLWAYVLWRLSRLHLALHATHPDGAGGLAFLAPAQSRFAVMAFAGGCIISGDVMVKMVFAHAQLQQVQWELVGYIVGSTLLVIAPLLCMTPLLTRVRRHDLQALGELGQATVQDFGARWRRSTAEGSPDHPGQGASGQGASDRGALDQGAFLDSPNASTLTDYTSICATARTMSVVPITKASLLAVALLAAAPLLPALLTAMSVDELIHKLLSVLA